MRSVVDEFGRIRMGVAEHYSLNKIYVVWLRISGESKTHFIPPRVIKDTMKMIENYERKGYRSIDEIETQPNGFKYYARNTNQNAIATNEKNRVRKSN